MLSEKIYYWPEWFYNSLTTTEKNKINRFQLNKLRQGQIYLWRALNIYDDFLDGVGQPAKLPIANTAFRHFLEIYYHLHLSPDFYKTFNHLLDNLDKANRSEAQALKLVNVDQSLEPSERWPIFPSLEHLADKSLALAVGPLAILDRLDYKASSHRSKNTLKFFRFCLAAKQLSDDARDWLEDLAQGKITAVNVLVLRAAKRRRLKLNLQNNLAIICQLFSEEAASKISKNLIRLCQAARQTGQLIKLSKNDQLIKKLLIPLEEAVEKALKFRRLLFKKD